MYMPLARWLNFKKAPSWVCFHYSKVFSKVQLLDKPIDLKWPLEWTIWPCFIIFHWHDKCCSCSSVYTKVFASLSLRISSLSTRYHFPISFQLNGHQRANIKCTMDRWSIPGSTCWDTLSEFLRSLSDHLKTWSLVTLTFCIPETQRHYHEHEHRRERYVARTIWSHADCCCWRGGVEGSYCPSDRSHECSSGFKSWACNM